MYLTTKLLGKNYTTHNREREIHQPQKMLLQWKQKQQHVIFLYNEALTVNQLSCLPFNTIILKYIVFYTIKYNYLYLIHLGSDCFGSLLGLGIKN